MENEPELIRDQMQETRTALTEKLDSLQQKVADTVESITTPVTETVQTVKEAVSDTVDSVKETVAGTVESVKETFNLPLQVERYPWPMMLGSVAAGFALGRLLPPPGRLGRVAHEAADTIAAGMSAAGRGHNGHHAAQGFLEREEKEPAAPEKGVFSGLAQAFQGELTKLKGLGVSVAAGLLRDLMTQSLHGEVGGRLKEWVDGLTETLGGKPLQEPLVSAEPEEGQKPSEEQDNPKRASSRKGRPHQGAAPRW